MPDNSNPTLFDNIDLLEAYRAISALNFPETRQLLQQASQCNANDLDEIENLQNLMEFWEPYCQAEKGNISTSAEIANLFSTYSFPPKTDTFQINLLKRLLPENWSEQNSTWTGWFDLLLNYKQYETAKHLLNTIDRNEPDNYCRFYFYGQLHWRMEDYRNCLRYYGKGLFFAPNFDYISRIESDEVKNLISVNGLYMAFLYGCLGGLFSLDKAISVPVTLNEQHQTAISLYQLVLSDLQNDKPNDTCIAIRKQIQALDPRFLKAYISNRERKGNNLNHH